MYQQIIKLLETLGLINTTSKIYDKPIKEQIMSKKIKCAKKIIAVIIVYYIKLGVGFFYSG